MEKENKIVIYRDKKGNVEFNVDIQKETIWANLNQIAVLFGRDKSVISRHIKDIFTKKELDKKSVVAFFATTAKDGKIYQIEYFNLDVIISVGYRVNSRQATHFRIWATKILKEYLTKGYTINRKQITKNYDSFLKTIESIKNLLPENITLEPKAVLDLIKEFANTWISLDAYDKESLTINGVTKKDIKLTAEELLSVIFELKNELITQKEASELFAVEKQKGSINGIIGNIMQTFDKRPLYKTIEEKAAHLLYFMVKNHPFIDGNKRSGAFAFIWFLKRTKVKGFRNINPTALTAITLLIAESHPKNKDQMVALITQLLK